ncbi:MAG: hypothetical protein IKV03_05065 [Alphaproteobacteria bacterium]|nr:hypothetical protein [Alphaproteobacteria bacterium]
MSMEYIKINRKQVGLKKTVINPNFDSKTVVTDNIYDYVELCIKRDSSIKRKKQQLLSLWNQSREFFNLISKVSKPVKPLLSYYCFLNATKTMLLYNNIPFSDNHGVAGSSIGNVSLIHEKIKFHTQGVLPALSQYFEENATESEYTVKDILYNLHYIHRAYCLSYKGTTELFIPILNSEYVYENSTREGYIQFELEQRNNNGCFFKTLPPSYEVNKNPKLFGKFIIRHKKRFNMNTRSDLSNIYKYNRKQRAHFFYISGPQRLWYLKRNVKNKGAKIINRYSTTLTFALMHKLSELSRYHPERLENIFESQMGWVINEFIEMAPRQFIDEIASEITKQEIMPPLFRK